VIFSYFYSDIYTSGKITKISNFLPSLKWTYFVYFYIVNELNASGLLL